MLRFPSNPQVSVRKGELLYLPAMWYHRVAQKGVSWLTAFFKIFSGCWLRRAKAVVGGDDDVDDDDRANRDGMIPRTHGDDKDDADGGASESSLLVSKLQDETLMILSTLFTFDARLQSPWTIGMICKLAMLFFITNFYVMLLTWTSFLERIIMWLDHWTPVDTADAEMPNDADEQDDLRSRRSRRREEIDLWKETIGHLYWQRPWNASERCSTVCWFLLSRRKIEAACMTGGVVWQRYLRCWRSTLSYCV